MIFRSCLFTDVVVDVYCPNPGSISNGHVVYRPAINVRRRPTPEPIEPDDPEFPVGGRLRYTCNSGYTLVGRSVLVCLESGSWSVDKPVCRRGTIFYGQHLRVSGTGRIFGNPENIFSVFIFA